MAPNADNSQGCAVAICDMAIVMALEIMRTISKAWRTISKATGLNAAINFMTRKVTRDWAAYCACYKAAWVQNELVFPAVDQIIALTKRFNMETAKAEIRVSSSIVPNPNRCSSLDTVN
jgi:hypothetical protein